MECAVLSLNFPVWEWGHAPTNTHTRRQDERDVVVGEGRKDIKDKDERRRRKERCFA